MIDSLRFLPLLGRILIVALFLSSGFEKVFKFQESIAYAAQHLPVANLAVIAAIVIELGGSAMLLLGLRARLVAAAIAAYSIVAAVAFHSNFSDPNEQIQFLKDIAIAGGLLQIVYFGAGPLSVDNRTA